MDPSLVPAVSPRGKRLILLSIIALAFGLRVVGIGFGLPHLYHADEPIVVNHALAYGTGDFNPHFFKIPPLVSYLLFFVYGLYFFSGRAVGSFKSLQDFEFLFYSDPSSFYLLARLVFGVLAGTVTVYAHYQLIDRYFSRKAAFLTAFLLAVCFLHVKDSHYVYADIPLLWVLVCAFIQFLKIQEKGDRRASHLAAGFWIGLAAAVKYNGIALVLPYLFISFFVGNRKDVLSRWALAGLSAAATYFLLNPFSLPDGPFFLEEIKLQSRSQGGADWLHHFRYSLAGGVGVPLLAAGVLGLAKAVFDFVKSKEKQKSAVALFVFCYYLLISVAGQPYDRYALPVIPFLIYLAVDFVIGFSRAFKLQSRGILTFCILIMALPNLIKSLLFDRVMLAKDTRTLAQEWVEQNLPPGSHLALDWDFYVPRLALSKNQLEDKKKEISQSRFFSEAQRRRLSHLLDHFSDNRPSYNLHFLQSDPSIHRFLFAKPVLPYDFSMLRDHGVEYVIVPLLRRNREPADFFERLKHEADLVQQWNPYRKASRDELVDLQPLTGGPFLFEDLLLRERNGPLLEIYRLKA